MPRRPLLGVILLGLSTIVHSQFRSVRVQIIDRGQADGIPIRTQTHNGSSSMRGANDRLQADAMRDVWSVDRLALVVASHRHADHYGGMARIRQTSASGSDRSRRSNRWSCPSHGDNAPQPQAPRRRCVQAVVKLVQNRH